MSHTYHPLCCCTACTVQMLTQRKTDELAKLNAPVFQSAFVAGAQETRALDSATRPVLEQCQCALCEAARRMPGRLSGMSQAPTRVPPSPIPVVYVAGPYRAANNWEIEQNVRRAEALSLRVWQAGAAAICPHTISRFFQGAAPDAVWLEGDLAILRRCDAVLVVEGWELSAGTRAEIREASARGIPVFYTWTGFELWLAQRTLTDPDAAARSADPASR